MTMERKPHPLSGIYRTNQKTKKREPIPTNELTLAILNQALNVDKVINQSHYDSLFRQLREQEKSAPAKKAEKAKSGGFLHFDNFAKLNSAAVDGKITMAELKKARDSGEINTAEYGRLAANLAETSEEKTEIDHLTGISNRRGMDKNLSYAIERLNQQGEHRRESNPDFVLFFIADVNRFKFFNDSQGHPQGDKLLIIVAKCFEEEAIERGGQASRYGGDEFAIMQVGRGVASSRNVREIAQRIENKINARLAIALKSAGMAGFNITVSVGGAELPKEEFKDIKNPRKEIEEMMSTLIKEADTMMYEKKLQSGLERGK
ncbi:hypothetical protein A3G53_00515 [Candidatus Nomurabacteria bacterium RIFCSPLOWO2_12_FULL_44_11]|uniref:GGDEF domain-containing protein n=1 Tax=Candidatus Nomurabacteria bacterium RIFCSPLOWO2_12_FULL_44_11 TaxID=1801796 RepID=A0A1F6Y6Z5_9BACT|nr:MAG: hypothetical protein A3G53_00515 [Candidatus Nomurabacteria bacterium RIFCSPLOWO2_12_FULL_44_11]